MSDNSPAKSRRTLLLVITPIIMLLVCIGITAIAMIKPYNKISVYLNLAFMDEFKTVPNSVGTNGLVIRENDIQTSHDGDTFDEGVINFPKFGEQYAVISANAFETNIPVFWGCANELFERGACQSTFSKAFGGNGHTVVSAHEDTFFANLSKIKIGDTITVNTSYGEFTYTVRENISFKKTEKKYVNPSDEQKLTLYTCKKNVLGSSDERVGVVCDLTGKKFYTPLSKEDNAE